MRIYTRTGDDGTTSLFGGQRLNKDELRIEAYGTMDELNVCMGGLAVHLTGMKSEHAGFLQALQSDVFAWGSHLATIDPDMIDRLPKIPDERVQEMEAWMDTTDKSYGESQSGTSNLVNSLDMIVWWATFSFFHLDEAPILNAYIE